MKKTCTLCGEALYQNAKYSTCMTCRGVCPCGMPKDYRAVECLPCGMSRKAKKQWANKRVAGLMRAGLAAAGLKRRTRFADLTAASFKPRPADGRLYAWYWGDDEEQHTIYRYQWVWVKEFGDIPDGFIIHHKDRDPTNDVLGNLEMILRADHGHLHGLERGGPKRPSWTCQNCGVVFQMYAREGVRKFCSRRCHYTSRSKAA